MKKKILISLVAVILSTGLTFGVLLALRPVETTQRDPNSASELVLDFSKDYQACNTLDSAVIKSALGETANELQPAKNLGIIGEQPLGEGTESVVADSHTCVYAFATGGNEENGFNAENSFILNKTLYTNQAGPAAVIDQIKQDPTIFIVETASGEVYYTANTSAEGPDAVYTFDLYAFSGNERTTFTIRQSAESATFTADSARTTLVSLFEQSSN